MAELARHRFAAGADLATDGDHRVLLLRGIRRRSMTFGALRAQQRFGNGKGQIVRHGKSPQAILRQLVCKRSAAGPGVWVGVQALRMPRHLRYNRRVDRVRFASDRGIVLQESTA